MGSQNIFYRFVIIAILLPYTDISSERQWPYCWCCVRGKNMHFAPRSAPFHKVVLQGSGVFFGHSHKLLGSATCNAQTWVDFTALKLFINTLKSLFYISLRLHQVIKYQLHKEQRRFLSFLDFVFHTHCLI